MNKSKKDITFEQGGGTLEWIPLTYNRMLIYKYSSIIKQNV